MKGTISSQKNSCVFRTICKRVYLRDERAGQHLLHCGNVESERREIMSVVQNTGPNGMFPRKHGLIDPVLNMVLLADQSTVSWLYIDPVLNIVLRLFCGAPFRVKAHQSTAI